MENRSVFVLLQDRNAGQNITNLSLSTKQDLIAFSTPKGEVFVYNNDWIKVGNYKSPDFLTGEVVTNLAWRPDGRALAIAFSSGKIVIKNVETHETINEILLDEKVEYLDWSPPYWTNEEMTKLESKRIFKDRTEDFIQQLGLQKSGAPITDQSKDADTFNSQFRMCNQRTLTILSAITLTKRICLYAFGFLPIAQIEIQEQFEYPIVEICQHLMSRDLSSIVLVVKDNQKTYWEAVYDISIIKDHSEELEILSKHNDYLWSYIKAIEGLFTRAQSMKDDTRHEMESKIRTLLKEFQIDCTAAGFLREHIAETEYPSHFLLAALMEQMLLGIIHPALITFFEHSFPSHELLKHETSLENSLKEVRAGFVPPFRKAIESCLVSLTILCRWIANEERFRIIGASRTNFDQIMQDCASFALKMFELQQMIETEAKRCLLTLTWLMGQSEMIREEKPMTARRLNEEELDEVVHVLQTVLGRTENRSGIQKFVPEWRMRVLDVEAYLRDVDLPEPLDAQRSDFQPYYDRIQEALSDFDPSSVSPRSSLSSLSTLHRTKSARQELNALKVAMNIAFPEILTTISKAIGAPRKTQLMKNEEKMILKLFPVESISPRAIQIVYGTTRLADELVFIDHDLNKADAETSRKKIKLANPMTFQSSALDNPVVHFIDKLGDSYVILIGSESSKEELILGSLEIVDQLPAVLPRSGSQIRNLISGHFQPVSCSILATNALRTVFAIVSNESRLRLFKLDSTPHMEIVDDTDRMAQQLRPDLISTM